MVRPTSRSAREDGPPTSFPEGPPSSMPWDHSFTLQAVMQMQKDLGVLSEKIDRMREDFVESKSDGKETRGKLSEVKESIASFKGAMKVFGGLYALALVLMAAFLAWYLRPATPAPVASVTTAVQSSSPEKVGLKEGAAEATPVVNAVPLGR